MIHQLRKIYSSLLLYTDGFDDSNHKYRWFMTEENEIIGIHEEELTAKDIAILTTFLSPYNIKFPIPTDEEKKWRNIIHATESNANVAFELNHPYRFVYFSLENNQIDPVLFRDAIHELFAKPVPILWLNGHEGIIIEEKIVYDESILFEQIIDVLMSDLYVKINFFVGHYKKGFEGIAQYYQSSINDAKMIFSYSSKRVVTYIDAVPYLLLDQTEPDLRARIGKTILQEYINDEETLSMIETFLQCNLNISETSKVLHMHRNSLQYRLDRFFEKTGIDIRSFHHAMTVYIALLAMK